MPQLPEFWLRDSLISRLLSPLGALTAVIARRRLARFRAHPGRLPVPVIVVGNIFVGGTGKTPLVAWIAEWLQARGRRPGILVRGYGGQAKRWPQAVTPDSDPADVGDEGVLLARRTRLPVAAGPDRRAAAQLLVDAGCDVLVSDDGLQHYGLPRDLEIVVVDAARGLGNGRCLPAGPLREPAERLAEVDLVIANGDAGALTPLAFRLVPESPRTVRDDAPGALTGRVHAVAGIGNPARFFDSLATLGLTAVPHPFPDHHRYRPADLDFPDPLPIVCTEKDAVKIRPFATARHWYLPVRAEPTPAARAALESVLTRFA